MKIFEKITILIAILLLTTDCKSQSSNNHTEELEETAKIIVGADQPDQYMPILKGKTISLVANQTSTVDTQHLVDFLHGKEIKIKNVFAPEHGFRGNTSDGVKIKSGIDCKTGIPLLSLYGKLRKPTKKQLEGVDIVIFDIQDVGCRFYTYISTMHYVMEACAEYGVTFMILDRPNPNGDYIAGPVREDNLKSFVGMHKIPIVHGLTVGELAKMIKGEKWIKNSAQLNLIIIPVANYKKSLKYNLPIKPSPNLPNYQSVRLYPSLCLFEATSVSVGRGTQFPFQVLGGTNPKLGDFTFIPQSIAGTSINPPNKGKVCYGLDLRKINPVPQLTLQYFIDFYNKYDNEDDFIISQERLRKLSGSNNILSQIRKGKSEQEIVATWEKELEIYDEMRQHYLIYPLN